MKARTGVAIYMRLSQDDGDCDAESNSIGNQRALLRAYVKKHFAEYELFEFQDDGYTGTNFNRPGVSALLEQVSCGRVNCIVVKDLSRFSRDYIEIGTYLEQIFPLAGVRFIAVGDDYDSDHYRGSVAGMDTSFQNLVNDLYCKDISVKVKAALAVKKEKGIYVSGSCAFGYRKDPKDRHILLIEEAEAVIVRRIFQMTVDGVSSHKIAQRLHAEGVKTPMEYKMEKRAASTAQKSRRPSWSGPMICHMLENAIYTGDLVYDKYETAEVGGKPKLRPKSEWKVLKNHHEAIIDRAVFEYVQRTRGKKCVVKYPRHPLTGKLECGCCHKSLKIARTKNPYFFCESRYVTRDEGCVSRVNAQFLEEYVLFKLQEELGEQRNMQRVIMQMKAGTEHAPAKTANEKKQIRARLQHLQMLQAKSYESYAQKEKSKTEYFREKQKLQEEMRKWEKALQKTEKPGNAEKPENAEKPGNVEKPEKAEIPAALSEKSLAGKASDACGYAQNDGVDELIQDAAAFFLKRIVVFDEEHIELEWKFTGKDA